MIDDRHEVHANSLKPKEICVSITFFEHVASEPAFKSCPQLRHYLVCTQYTKEKVRSQPQCAQKASFLEVKQLQNRCKQL